MEADLSASSVKDHDSTTMTTSSTTTTPSPVAVSQQQEAVQTATQAQAAQAQQQTSQQQQQTQQMQPSFATSLLAGGLAGLTVDICLFPIDTLKTRLQAPVGFWKAGGFAGIYRGLGATATGSAPGAALFFCTYEAMKPVITQQQLALGQDPNEYAYVSHMLAASTAEAVACLVRVPTEVVKSKMQTSTGQEAMKLLPTTRAVWQEQTGTSLAWLTGGLYRGYGITLFREIPFAVIQFPLYEQMKQSWALHQQIDAVNPLQAAVCGSVAGGIAGAVTTPLDVLKTRLMLGSDQHGVPYRGVTDVLTRTWRNDGPMALWRGFQPRVFWISLGGFVFLGAWEAGKVCLVPVFG